MLIRRETEKDYKKVESLIGDAFYNVNVPGATEHYLAHIMREHNDFIKELDLVAEIDGMIVGSIMYVRCELISEDGKTKPCLTFGPLAVHPDYQRKGIGKALMNESFKIAKELGYDSIVIFGHPGNYVSSGFVSSKKVNVCLGDNIFPTAMLVKTLNDNVFDGIKWEYKESSAYELDFEKAEEFDKLFPTKEKKVLPSQEEFFIYSHSLVND
ncbi:MAG: GNAT family N-acetyltransferase [Bacilli bacterium]